MESIASPGNPLRQVTDFALVAQRQHAHGVVLHHESIKGYISRSTERNDQFPKIPFHATAEQWMRSQRAHRGLDRLGGGDRSWWVLC